jgi:uncharacterized protein
MGKLLVLIALVVIAFWLLKRALQRASQGDQPPQGKTITGDLVACAHCGLNLPRAEARAVGADFFCGEEHARLGRK